METWVQVAVMTVLSLASLMIPAPIGLCSDLFTNVDIMAMNLTLLTTKFHVETVLDKSVKVT